MKFGQYFYSLICQKIFHTNEFKYHRSKLSQSAGAAWPSAPAAALPFPDDHLVSSHTCNFLTINKQCHEMKSILQNYSIQIIRTKECLSRRLIGKGTFMRKKISSIQKKYNITNESMIFCCVW